VTTPVIVNALGELHNPNAAPETAGSLLQSSSDIRVDARTLAEAHASGLLERRGWSQERIAKVMGGNFTAYAQRIWGG
jgi:hypothetical protein